MIITLVDYLLLPLYFLLLLFIVLRRSAKYNGTDLKNICVKMFLAHVLGSVLHSAMLQYYYGTGDAFIYFGGGEFLKQSFFSTGKYFKIFFMPGDALFELPGAGDIGLYASNSLRAPSSLSAMKFSAAFSFLSFGHFLINAMFSGFISFVGTWRLFKVFNDISKEQFQKRLALFMIWTPTIWFWGSGAGKDSLTLGLLGLLISGLYGLLKKRKMFANLLIVIATTYILFSLKAAVLGITAAACCGYAAIAFLNRTRNIIVKLTAILFFAAGFIIFFIASIDNIKSSLDEIQQLVEVNTVAYSMENEGSEGGFKPPDISITPAGIAADMPARVFSTLYRPFLWESRKVVILFAALESFVMLLALVIVFFKRGILAPVKAIVSQPAVMFCFIFCTLMAMIVGFTTFNFGTMVRYRLPLLPFYIFMILSILAKGKKKGKPDEDAGLSVLPAVTIS